MKALALLLAILCASTAHADAERPLLVRLAPTAERVQAERTARTERALARALASWPGVEHVEVVLREPLAADSALDRALPPPSVSVVVRHRGAPPARAAIFPLLHAAVPALSANDFTLLALPAELPSDDAAARAEVVSVGPFRVAPESALALRVALAVSLAIHALLAGIVLWRLRADRSLVRKVDPRARSSNPP